jgi:hypothetical protein
MDATVDFFFSSMAWPNHAWPNQPRVNPERRHFALLPNAVCLRRTLHSDLRHGRTSRIKAL